MTPKSGLSLGEEDRSLSFSLTMLNLWIGMCRGVAGLPRGLRDLGYEDQWIDHPFANQDNEVVVPDLIIASCQRSHTLILEWKDGANTKPDQLRRYSRVSEEDLKNRAYIAGEAARGHDVVIVGQAAYAPRLQMGIQDGGYLFPLLSVEECGVSLRLHKFSAPEVNQLFNPLLEVEWDNVPTSFVPIDGESEPLEVAEVVIPVVLSCMCKRMPRVDLTVICSDACNTWSIMGKEPQNAIRRRVASILEDAASLEFNKYFRWRGRGNDSGVLEFKSNPLDLHPSKLTTAYQALQSMQLKLLKRLGKGRPVQLRLSM